ncbi:heme exporter protein CcmD [Roseinatronobacter sp.]|uniref:heme exporter protein CcmD n=1 Tax=Roseinatronobacter sp. TaxID=1945755 RepID=UPI0025FB73CF|nr:heme exporter protein CcmD [Rhodobaca sp.]
MMPDLGRYALEVSLAYLVSLGMIGVLVLWYWMRGRAVRRQLDEIETRRGKNE